MSSQQIQFQNSASPLDQIHDLLSKAEKDSTPSKSLTISIGSCCRAIENGTLSDSDFAKFLREVHDHIVTKDTAIRSVLLRSIRYGTKTSDACQLILDQGIHILVILSLEKEPDYSWERMQALKLMKKFLDLSPKLFPIGFARSLVAIAAEKGDNFRRVALETLRELGIRNPAIAHEADAFRILFDAVIDPTTSELSESILLSMLHLLNNGETRKYVRPQLDLQSLLSPFTDFDAAKADEQIKRYELAKSALVIMMRSWVGLVELTSDPMGLPAIIQLLSDPKVSNQVKEAILDSLSTVCDPLINKLEFRKLHGSSHVVKQSNIPPNAIMPIPKPSKIKASRRSTMAQPALRTEKVIVRTRSNTDGSRMQRNDSLTEDILRPIMMKGRADSISRIINDSSNDPDDPNPRSSEPDNLTPLAFSFKKSTSDNSSKSNSNSNKGQKFPFSPTGQPIKGNRLSMWTRFTTHAELAEKITVDPIYNMLDNYAGLLCCSFIHVRLFDSLCWLCSHGDIDISSRSKDLLVDLMGVVSKVCTERLCSDLLTLPSLIEYAASASSMKYPDRAYKAADLLLALSNAFSVSKTKDNYSSQSSIDNRPISTAIKSNKKLSSRGFDIITIKKDSHGQPLSSIIDILVQTSFISGVINSKQGELAYELKLFMNSSIDKYEFSKQMEMTRILGKEGKEPFKWDWALISDLLDYSLRNTERLNEALKTKFVKRLSGFYRCSTEDKGYFANLEWEPCHLHFLESACNLYYILSENESTTHFLSSDRRGMIFAELVRDLEAVITYAASTKASNNNNSNMLTTSLLNQQVYSTKNGTLNVFRPAGCMQTMSREYFCLIGRLCHSTHGRYILNSCQTYDHLSHLSHYVSLDYLSRVVLTALGFTDGGFMSKDLLQIYTTSGATSNDLRMYCHTLLRALLRSRSKECCEWGIELMVEQLMFPHISRKSIIRCIEEAVQDRDYLKILISKEPEIVGDDMNNLCTRFLAIEEGINYLQKLEWVEPQLQLWKNIRCKEYASRIEMTLAKALNTTYMKNQQSVITKPIPIKTFAFSNHPSAPSGLQYPDGGVDIEGLLRVPWNIEVKIVAPSGVSLVEPEYLKIDAYLDSSDLACPSSGDMTSDNLRIIKVRGIVLDSKGIPSPQPILNDRTIMTSLLCGVCPVMKDGTVIPSSEWSSTSSSFGINTTNGNSNSSSMNSQDSRTNSTNMTPQYNSIHRRRKSILKNSYSSSDILGIRASYSDAPPLDLNFNQEPPITLLSDNLQDWIKCKPSHRQKIRQLDLMSNNTSYLADDDRYAIEIPDEPVVLIFSRTPPRFKQQQGGGGDRASTPPARYNVNSHIIYLVEVHYYLRLQTGQSTFLPLPRHMYGELARSSAGIMLLLSKRIIRDLFVTLKSPETSSSEFISSLWAIGHIASTENGFQAVVSNDPQFVPWCIEKVTEASSYSIRACVFSVLGLLSRTESGSQQLLACHWESAPIHYVAVAMPKDPSVLFQSALSFQSEKEKRKSNNRINLGVDNDVDNENILNEEEGRIGKIPFQSNILKSRVLRSNSSFMGMTFDGLDAPVEALIVECISKLPGQILYKDAYNNLMKLHQNYPDIFQSRRMYLIIHDMLAHYNFKLSVRRLLINLFSVQSKKLSP